jgi:hypothetical protein
MITSVAWRVCECRGGSGEWTTTHATKDGRRTLCGREIPIPDGPIKPSGRCIDVEKEDYGDVTCATCRKIMEDE